MEIRPYVETDEQVVTALWRAVFAYTEPRNDPAAIIAHKLASQRGCPKINLQALSSNSAVVAFYRTLGYKVEERVSMGKVL